METRAFHVMDSPELDELVQTNLSDIKASLGWEFEAEEEAHGGVCYKYEGITKAVVQASPIDITYLYPRLALAFLCERGHIPVGDYLIVND